jgi:hypothetical protein
MRGGTEDSPFAGPHMGSPLCIRDGILARPKGQGTKHEGRLQ